MTPQTIIVRRVGVTRILLVCAFCCWLLWRYFVAPVLDGIDRMTPWDGALPGACTTAPEVRPAGWTGMLNDAGQLVHNLADGPPSPERMVGWFRDAGTDARASWVAFEAGTEGRQLLPLAPTPVPQTRQVDSGSSMSDQQVAALAVHVGWPAAEIPQVVARVRAESGGDPLARDYDTGTHHGLLQLGTAEQARYLDPGASAMDPAANLTGALRLWQDRGWQPWAASDSATVVRPVAACAPVDPGAVQASFANGQAPADALVPTSLGVEVRRDVAPSLEALQQAFTARWGQPLVATDGYRSYEAQVDVKRRKPGLAAVPGTSNHGWGQAVDLAGPVARFGTPQYAWLLTHAPEFGWHNPPWAQVGGSRPESWHWEVVEGGAKQAG